MEASVYGRTALVTLIACMVSCKGNAPGLQSEADPAPPCSLNGMLFRDTPDTNFERCGSSGLPLSDAVSRCIQKASAAEKPFVVELEANRLSRLSGYQIAMAGAHFGKEQRYEVRMYTELSASEGQREGVDLVLTSPTSGVELMPDMGSTLTCSHGDAPPHGDFEPVAGVEQHRFHAGSCREWIDAKANIAWVFHYDPAHVLDCPQK